MAIKRAPHAHDAEARAKAKVGHSNEVGMCAHEVIVNILGIPAPWRWGGNGRAWAYNYFLGAQKVVKTNDPMKIPAGAVVIHKPRPGATTTGGKAGHIAIGAGNGYEYSTDLPHEGRWGKVKISYVEEQWGKELAGYVLVDGMGYDVSPPAAAAAKPPVAVWGKPETFVIGATGDAVTKLGQRIVVWSKALGLPNPYSTGPGSPLTARDVSALARIQKAWGDEDHDGYPGPRTFARLAAEPAQTKDVTAFYLNAADYDSAGKGQRTRVARSPEICAKAIEGHPMWILLVESAADTLAARDKGMVGYQRVGAGGKGREAWYAKDAGVTILQAQLLRAKPELDGDDKPFLVIAWEADGYKAVTTVFHNENQGTSVQRAQLAYVRIATFGVAKAHDVDASNVLIVGDANRKEAAADLTDAGMLEAGVAPSTTDLQFHSTNGWGVTTSTGRRIDVAALGAGGRWVYAKMLRLAKAISDHNPFRLAYQLTK